MFYIKVCWGIVIIGLITEERERSCAFVWTPKQWRGIHSSFVLDSNDIFVYGPFRWCSTRNIYYSERKNSYPE